MSDEQHQRIKAAWVAWHSAEVAYGDELGQHVPEGWLGETPMQIPGKSLDREALERLKSLRAEAQARMEEYLSVVDDAGQH